MDVEQLAPALLAIGNLLKVANSKINDRAKLNVLVRSDFEPFRIAQERRGIGPYSPRASLLKPSMRSDPM